jgi:hypothetical protein
LHAAKASGYFVFNTKKLIGGREMMNGDMSSWQWGFGYGHWIFGVLIWGAVILLIAVAIKYLIKK